MNTTLRILSLALLAGSSFILFGTRTFAAYDPDNPPPVGACCPCILVDEVTVAQLEKPSNQTLAGPEKLAKSECIKVKEDKTGQYHLKFVIPNTCTEDPTVLLRDAKGQQWQGSGDEVEFSLAARQVELPLQAQIVCPDGEICLGGCISGGGCGTCGESCPTGLGDLEGQVSSDGEGGPDGEFSGEMGVGNSDHGDTETGLRFELDPTEDLAVGDLKITSNGGFTSTPSGSNVDIRTGTTHVGISPSGSDVKVEFSRIVDPDGTPTGGSGPESTPFKTILFTNLSGNVLRADTTDHDNSSTSWQEWRYTETPVKKWVHVSGSGMRMVVLTVEASANPAVRIDRRKVYERHAAASGEVADVAGNLISDVTTHWTLFASQWKKTKEIIDPSGAALVTEWDYYESGEQTYPSSYSGALLLRWMRRYDGYEENHYYGTNVHWVTTPFTSSSTRRSVTTTWDPAAKKKTVSETLNGTEVGRTEVTYGATSETKVEYCSSSQWLTTVTTFGAFGSDFGGKPTKIQHRDGTITTYSYNRSGGGKAVTTATGAGTTTVTEGTSTVSTYSPKGLMVEQKSTAVGTGSGTVLSHKKYHSVDAFDRPLTVYYFPDGSGANPKWTETFTYNCCGVSTETDRYGIQSSHVYDALKRRISTTRLGLTTTTVYDALTVTTQRVVPMVGTFDLSKAVANLSGTTTEEYSPSPQSGTLEKMSTTVDTYLNPGGSTPNPGGLAGGIGRKSVTTVIQVADDEFVDRFQAANHFLDGRIYRIWGDLQPAESHAYSIYGGLHSVRHSIYKISGSINATNGTGGSLFESHNTIDDWLGRVAYESFGGGTRYHYYTAGGLLDYVKDPDNVFTRFAYNSVSERVTTAQKLNGTTGSITWGTDRITHTETKPATRGSSPAIPVLRTTSKVWRDGDTSSTGGTIVSIVDRTPDGLRSWSEVVGVSGVASTTITLLGDGDWTEELVDHDQSKTVTSYVDGLWDSTEQKASGGNLISWTSARKADNSLGYDEHKRLKHVKDSRTGVTVKDYRSDTSDAVVKITPPAGSIQATAYAYDHRGRRVQVDAPQSLDANGGTLENITTTKHNPSGSVKEVSGGQAYPVTYTYDYAGRMLTMTTNSAAGSSTTKWVYSPSTGRLTDKLYNWTDDATANEFGPAYTYTSAGRLLTRSWAREASPGVKVKATYGYTFGLLTSIDYNDTTPDVVYNYDAFPTSHNHIPGDLETVTRDGVTWTYSYNASTLRLESEMHPVGGTSINRILTRLFDDQGRPEGFDLGYLGDSNADHSVAYDYDTAGRLDEVSGAGQTFTYGYETNSYGLVHSVSGPVDILVTNTWETDRDALSVKRNEIDGDTHPVSQFTYGVNDFGQRTGVETDGTAFSNTDRGWTWGYDALGQVTKATHAASPATLDRAYAYDNIGNRTGATDGSGGGATTVGYTPNKLNQYEEIDPGTEVNPVHDLDGNLTEDAGINALTYGLKFEWDAENRITAVRKADDTLLATYTYDHLSRRIRKTTTAEAYQGASDIGYLYDGWNIVAEYEISSGPAITLEQAYTWGLDLSGSLQGAGGVGGLRCIHRGPGTDGSGNRTWTDTFYLTYDGNGNVSEYLDENGDEVAHFEYDPFGRVGYHTGSVGDFNYRFSTKPQDFETGLYYYGYRYYDPLTGRWPSRYSSEVYNPYSASGNDLVQPGIYAKGGVRQPARPTGSRNGRGGSVVPGVQGPRVEQIPRRDFPNRPRSEPIPRERPSRPRRNDEGRPEPKVPRLPQPLNRDPLTRKVPRTYHDRNGDTWTQYDYESSYWGYLLMKLRTPRGPRFRNCCDIKILEPKIFQNMPESELYPISLGLFAEVKVTVNDSPPCPRFPYIRKDKNFDGILRDGLGRNVLVETKTGLGGLNHNEAEKVAEAEREKAIADYCGYPFIIAVDNQEGADAWQEAVGEGIEVEHVPWPGGGGE